MFHICVSWHLGRWKWKHIRVALWKCISMGETHAHVHVFWGNTLKVQSIIFKGLQACSWKHILSIYALPNCFGPFKKTYAFPLWGPPNHENTNVSRTSRDKRKQQNLKSCSVPLCAVKSAVAARPVTNIVLCAQNRLPLVTCLTLWEYGSNKSPISSYVCLFVDISLTWLLRLE